MAYWIQLLPLQYSDIKKIKIIANKISSLFLLFIDMLYNQTGLARQQHNLDTEYNFDSRLL